MSAPEPGSSRRPGEFDFQNASRASHSDQAVPLGGVPRALREAAQLAGLDPVTSLYNEALRYAQEGHLRLARERLQMLLCMAPDDGEARLMLARVFVAGQRWSDALAALDEATSCGVEVPMSLRRAVEEHLRAERATNEEQHGATKAREQGEVRALRIEARRLRSEHAQQLCQIADLEREVRKWAWATASVSALTIVFIVGSLALGSQSSEIAPLPEPPAPEAAPLVPAAPAEVAREAAPEPEAPPEAEPEAPPAPPVDLGARVAQALSRLSNLEPGALSARVDGHQVVLEGEVPAFRDRRAAERAISGIIGVESVDASAVKLRVRNSGAIHVVEKGDTLSHISYSYYGSTKFSDRIAKANGLEGEVLRIGQNLAIPALQR